MGVLTATPGRAEAQDPRLVEIVELLHRNEAFEALAQAVAMDPTNAFFLSELGLAQALAGQPGKALDNYRRAHRLGAVQADDPSMRAIDARALRGMGKAARAGRS
ncbi:hypothetical protein MTR62_02600 [Novosphingobium sp. 1949]|uniref:Tetratricopeptide repeat protein n=1 Tax=Novosphingobium organovorum TaxID=2930092 RepID=A0ABT0B9Y6_9SPHN|nr:hypothetical protein [Novosphingobium organovorum]MCJ2181604.1 hypothetical protein [Novosphingobium organovorum]